MTLKDDGTYELPYFVDVFTVADIVINNDRYKRTPYEIPYEDVWRKRVLPVDSDPTIVNSDYDALDDSVDLEPLYHNPDPLYYSNVLSVEMKYIPLQKTKTAYGLLGRKLTNKWDCDVYISIIQSCDLDVPVFIVTDLEKNLSEAFLISEDLKKRLINADNGYEDYPFVPNTAACHSAKLETIQLVPAYFEEESDFFYGCWFHNYSQETAIENYYSNLLSLTTQALLVYSYALSFYQSRLLSTTNNTVSLQSEEYSEIAKAASSEQTSSPYGVPLEKTYEYGLIKKNNFKKFTVKNKHLSSTEGNWEKFNVNTEVEAHAIVDDAITNGTITDIKFNKIGTAKQRSYKAIIETGKIIGSKGETAIYLIYDELGNVWSTYPVKRSIYE